MVGTNDANRVQLFLVVALINELCLNIFNSLILLSALYNPRTRVTEALRISSENFSGFFRSPLFSNIFAKLFLPLLYKVEVVSHPVKVCSVYK